VVLKEEEKRDCRAGNQNFAKQRKKRIEKKMRAGKKAQVLAKAQNNRGKRSPMTAHEKRARGFDNSLRSTTKKIAAEATSGIWEALLMLKRKEWETLVAIRGGTLKETYQGRIRRGKRNATAADD